VEVELETRWLRVTCVCKKWINDGVELVVEFRIEALDKDNHVSVRGVPIDMELEKHF
jgi:hypothetical protein